jgi:hypothetical protein
LILLRYFRLIVTGPVSGIGWPIFSCGMPFGGNRRCNSVADGCRVSDGAGSRTQGSVCHCRHALAAVEMMF